MNKLYLVVLFLLSQFVGFGQADKWTPYQKGRMFFYWGWNRAAYTNSTISLKGDDYNLVIEKAKARDRPTTPVTFHNYLQLDRLTIPQNNWRIGYFIKDNLALSFGVDHMKYVMVQDQWANVTGTITREGPFQGTYNGNTQLTPDFLTFEHTDGLNYVHFGIDKYNVLYHNRTGNMAISGIFSGGAGMLFPRTNVKLLDYERNDRFHVSGFGLSGAVGFEVLFWKHLGLRFEGKGGYINMPDIILHKKGINGQGKQDFVFGEMDGTIVWNFGFHRNALRPVPEVK